MIATGISALLSVATQEFDFDDMRTLLLTGLAAISTTFGGWLLFALANIFTCC